MALDELLEWHDRLPVELRPVDVVAMDGEGDYLVLAVEVEVTLRDAREVAAAEDDDPRQDSAPRYGRPAVDVHQQRELV
jgi:hypothetical protein